MRRGIRGEGRFIRRGKKDDEKKDDKKRRRKGEKEGEDRGG